MSIKKDIQNIASNIRMSKAEKVEMRTALQEYMEIKPIRIEESACVTKKLLLPSLHSSLRSLLAQRALPALLIVALVFGSGAATVFAAQDALPGDKLYGIKIASEKVGEKMALTENRKVLVATKIAERRLREAKILKERGVLSTEMEEELLVEVEKYSKKAEETLTKLEKKKPERATRARAHLERFKKRALEHVKQSENKINTNVQKNKIQRVFKNEIKRSLPADKAKTIQQKIQSKPKAKNQLQNIKQNIQIQKPESVNKVKRVLTNPVTKKPAKTKQEIRSYTKTRVYKKKMDTEQLKTDVRNKIKNKLHNRE